MAYGPYAETFTGHIDNTDIFKLMVQAIGLPDRIHAKLYNSKIAEAVDLAEAAVNAVEGTMNNFERDT